MYSRPSRNSQRPLPCRKPFQNCPWYDPEAHTSRPWPWKRHKNKRRHCNTHRVLQSKKLEQHTGIHSVIGGANVGNTRHDPCSQPLFFIETQEYGLESIYSIKKCSVDHFSPMFKAAPKKSGCFAPLSTHTTIFDCPPSVHCVFAGSTCSATTETNQSSLHTRYFQIQCFWRSFVWFLHTPRFKKHWVAQHNMPRHEEPSRAIRLLMTKMSQLKLQLRG